MWGQELPATLSTHRFRIIPTRVGTSICDRRKYRFVGDHPHACGDKTMPKIVFANQTGSSPRVWGQEGFRCGMQGWQRIIPTRVGTRKETQNFVQSAKDHPHACGDKRIKKILKGIAKGSSPRVWGQERSCIIVPL